VITKVFNDVNLFYNEIDALKHRRPIRNSKHSTAQLSILSLAVWRSGNALPSIDIVALRQTRLVRGWVTVCGRVNHFGM